MSFKFTSYNLGFESGLLKHEILRKCHHNLAHRRNCEDNFVGFCEEICRVAERVITAASLKRDTDTRKSKNYNQELKTRIREVRNYKRMLEETIFQTLIGKGKCVSPFEDPVDVVYVEDIENGNVLLFDGDECGQTEKANINQRFNVAKKTVKFSYFLPEGYELAAPVKVDYEKALINIKRRTQFKKESYPDKHRKESEKFNLATFRHAYTQQTLQGEQLVQNLYLKLKDGQFKAAENETKFYYLVSDIITKKVEREEKRFQSLETIDDYIRWVCKDPNFKPKPCDKENLDEKSIFVDNCALSRLYTRVASDFYVTDFHKCVAIVKEATIYTLDDISNKSVIFGGLKRECLVAGKTYPFQDIIYSSVNKDGKLSLSGLEERIIEVTLPTISQYPYNNPNIFLYFNNEPFCDNEEVEEFLDQY